MESIVEQQRKLLAELKVLLKRDPFPMKRSHLLKIVALNIFLLEHNMHKGKWMCLIIFSTQYLINNLI